MALPQTEMMHTAATALDAQPDADVLAHLLQGQADALAAVSGATDSIAAASALMVEAIQAGRTIIYAAAGSSALAALSDATELQGTFGIDPSQIKIFMAGGIPTDARMPGNTEDDAAEAAVAANTIAADDVVIGITASGSTPYTCEVASIARKRGAKVIAIANNPGAQIFQGADVAICLPTPPEVIAGSTRMGAATAQKATLNLMSTLMGVRLGHVHDGFMVNLKADNAKLRKRAAGMVAAIAGCSADTAEGCLNAADGHVKQATLLALGVETPAQAEDILYRTGGNLRSAMTRLKTPV